jgi:enamine deaminase RidA (YjgF/YER057c/UK114 family)
VTPYDRLAELGITLPPVTPPAAAFTPFVQTGNVVYVSGQIARREGRPWTGRLGHDLQTADGQAAARQVAIDLLAVLHAATGDLARVRRIVKMLVLVSSAPDFAEQHLVANGASLLLQDVLGPAGLHARSAIGVAALPLGACVEAELVAEVASGGPRTI